MKQTLQLRLGQQLTMTPQLQQAIRLLQLSALDLQQEIQEALESNPLLDLAEDDGTGANGADSGSDSEARDGERERVNGEERTTAAAEPDREVEAGRDQMPDELPVDSDWSDVYDSYVPSGPATAASDSDNDFMLQRGAAPTLHDHLMWQMNLSRFGPTDLAIATAIIDAINEDGYLDADLDEILAAVRSDLDEPPDDEEALGLPEIEAVLHRIQSFDPPGVAARDPRDCLLIQLQQLDPKTAWRDLAIRLCRDHFDLLAARDHNQIKRQLGIEDADLAAISELIRSLNPRPGTLVAEPEPQYIIPDVFVSRRQGRWMVELNPDATPRLRVNADYARLVRRADQSADNNFLKNHLQEARWFLKSLASRSETLLKVATKIVEFQRGFFEHGDEAMRPLVLRDVAEALGMHESTISRVTTQKYMHTPRGTYEFKYFFSSHLSTASGGECSSTAIRALIKKLVAAENPAKPLSDSKIAAVLSEQGIEVARRTVAKYREALAIPPSNERRRLL